eukprot:113776-Amphidinium_carterae.1
MCAALQDICPRNLFLCYGTARDTLKLGDFGAHHSHGIVAVPNGRNLCNFRSQLSALHAYGSQHMQRAMLNPSRSAPEWSVVILFPCLHELRSLSTLQLHPSVGSNEVWSCKGVPNPRQARKMCAQSSRVVLHALYTVSPVLFTL